MKSTLPRLLSCTRKVQQRDLVAKCHVNSRLLSRSHVIAQAAEKQSARLWPEQFGSGHCVPPWAGTRVPRWKHFRLGWLRKTCSHRQPQTEPSHCCRETTTACSARLNGECRRLVSNCLQEKGSFEATGRVKVQPTQVQGERRSAKKGLKVGAEWMSSLSQNVNVKQLLERRWR